NVRQYRPRRRLGRMLDIRLFREQPDMLKHGLQRMKVDPQEVDRVRELDERVRALKTEAETKKAEMNAASKALGKASPEEREAKRAELRALGDSINEADKLRGEVERALNDLLLQMPNLPDDRVPDGTSEDDNVIVRAGGTVRQFDFTPKPHWEIGAN